MERSEGPIERRRNPLALLAAGALLLSGCEAAILDSGRETIEQDRSSIPALLAQCGAQELVSQVVNLVKAVESEESGTSLQIDGKVLHYTLSKAGEEISFIKGHYGTWGYTYSQNLDTPDGIYAGIGNGLDTCENLEGKEVRCKGDDTDKMPQTKCSGLYPGSSKRDDLEGAIDFLKQRNPSNIQ